MIEIRKINTPGEECILVTVSDGSHVNASGICFMYEPGTTFEFRHGTAEFPTSFFPSKKEIKHWNF